MTFKEVKSLIDMLISEDFNDAVLAHGILSTSNPNPLTHPVLFILDKQESLQELYLEIEKITSSKLWTRDTYVSRRPGYYKSFKNEQEYEYIILDIGNCERYYWRQKRFSRR